MMTAAARDSHVVRLAWAQPSAACVLAEGCALCTFHGLDVDIFLAARNCASLLILGARSAGIEMTHTSDASPVRQIWQSIHYNKSPLQLVQNVYRVE